MCSVQCYPIRPCNFIMFGQCSFLCPWPEVYLQLLKCNWLVTFFCMVSWKAMDCNKYKVKVAEDNETSQKSVRCRDHHEICN